MKTKSEGDIEFACKPHQMYNSLMANISTNRSLAETFKLFGDHDGWVKHVHRANYQEDLLTILFGVNYEDEKK